METLYRTGLYVLLLAAVCAPTGGAAVDGEATDGVAVPRAAGYGERVEWHKVGVGVMPPSPDDKASASGQKWGFDEVSVGTGPSLSAPSAPKPTRRDREEEPTRRPWITAADFEDAEKATQTENPYGWLEDAREEFLSRADPASDDLSPAPDEGAAPSLFTPGDEGGSDEPFRSGRDLLAQPGPGQEEAGLVAPTMTTAGIERRSLGAVPRRTATDRWGTDRWQPGAPAEAEETEVMPRTRELLSGTMDSVWESLRPSYGPSFQELIGPAYSPGKIELASELDRPSIRESSLGPEVTGTPGNRARRLDELPSAYRARFSDRAGRATAFEPSGFGPGEPAEAVQGFDAGTGDE